MVLPKTSLATSKSFATSEFNASVKIRATSRMLVDSAPQMS